MDRYTKGVLTVIAAALVVLLAQNTLKPAVADTAPACGTSRDPCLVVPAYLDTTNGFSVWKPCSETSQTCFAVKMR